MGNRPTHFIYAYDLSSAMNSGFFEGLFSKLPFKTDQRQKASNYYIKSLMISTLKNVLVENMKVSIIKFAGSANILT